MLLSIFSCVFLPSVCLLWKKCLCKSSAHFLIELFGSGVCLVLFLFFLLSWRSSLYLGWWWFSCYIMSDSCDTMDCSLPSSSVHGILQARILGWVAISLFRGSSRPRNRTWVSRIVGIFWATRKALIFWILTPYQMLDLQISPLILYIVCLFVEDFSCCAEAL